MIVGYLLILLGIFGLIAGGAMFGDIGIAAMIGAGAALLAGIGLLGLSRRVSALERSQRKENS